MLLTLKIMRLYRNRYEKIIINIEILSPFYSPKYDITNHFCSRSFFFIPQYCTIWSTVFAAFLQFMLT